MGKGQILRLKEDFELTPALNESLTRILGEFQVKYYSEKKDFSKLYEERINSILNAFNFILAADPPKEHVDFLKGCAASFRAECRLDSNDFNKLQETLGHFTAKLTSLLVEFLDIEPDSALERLNEAEQYSLLLLSKPKEDIATLLPMKNGTFLLLCDKRLPSYTQEVLNELKSIQLCQAPATPASFRDMEAYVQAYFCFLSDKNTSWTDLHKEFHEFLQEWLKVTKEFPELKKNLNLINDDQIQKRFNKSQQNMLQALLDENTCAETIYTSKFQEFDNFITQCSSEKIPFASLKNISQLPQWYWLLSPHQQKFIGHVLATSSVEDAFYVLNSRLRWIPGLPNLRQQLLHVLSQNGELIYSFDKGTASAHPASRNTLNHPPSVQNWHVESNLRRIASEGKKAFLGTLISPLSYLPIPDPKLDALLQKMLCKHPDIDIAINHPFNYARLISYTSSADEKCQAFLKSAQKAADPDNPTHSMLIDNYKKALESSWGSATWRDYYGRELFLSSYEQLIMMHLFPERGCHLTCVSGKDRTAISFLHTTALILFFLEYGYWLELNAKGAERENFANIVAHLYLSGHIQEVAAQNAPGVAAIKNAGTYWPPDITKAINQYGDLTTESKMADNNELRCIPNVLENIKKYKIKNTLSSNNNSESFNLVFEFEDIDKKCRLAAESIGPKKCQALINTISLLLDETILFICNSRFFRQYLPEGIVAIQNILNTNKKNDTDNIWIAAEIFKIASTRPQTNSNRPPAAELLYKALMELIEEPEHIDRVIFELDPDNVKKSLFMKRCFSEPDFTKLTDKDKKFAYEETTDIKRAHTPP